MRVGIIGVGAIGGWIGARLAGAGHEVACLARGDTLAALRARGLTLDAAGATSVHAVAASDDATALGVQDLLVVAVKGPSLGVAAAAARPMIGPDTMILPLLNGVPFWFRLPGDDRPLAAIDPAGAIAAALPREQVIGAVVHATGATRGPGQVVLGNADRLILGLPDGAADRRVATLAGLFAAAGLPAKPSDAVMRDAWYKLWGNMTMNPLSALTRATTDTMLADPLLTGLVLAIMAEAAAIGAAIGCLIAEDGAARIAVTQRLGPIRSSMLQDVEAGRAIELDSLLAAPLEIAARLGLAAPNMAALFGVTRVMARSLGLYPPG